MQPTTRQVLDYSSYSTLPTRASSFDTRARLELDFHYSARLDTRLFGTRTIPNQGSRCDSIKFSKVQIESWNSSRVLDGFLTTSTSASSYFFQTYFRSWDSGAAIAIFEKKSYLFSASKRTLANAAKPPSTDFSRRRPEPAASKQNGAQIWNSHSKKGRDLGFPPIFRGAITPLFPEKCSI